MDGDIVRLSKVYSERIEPSVQKRQRPRRDAQDFQSDLHQESGEGEGRGEPGKAGRPGRRLPAPRHPATPANPPAPEPDNPSQLDFQA